MFAKSIINSLFIIISAYPWAWGKNNDLELTSRTSLIVFQLFHLQRTQFKPVNAECCFVQRNFSMWSFHGYKTIKPLVESYMIFWSIYLNRMWQFQNWHDTEKSSILFVFWWDSGLQQWHSLYLLAMKEELFIIALCSSDSFISSSNHFPWTSCQRSNVLTIFDLVWFIIS